jgi:DNA-binding response OmpR family regulator
VTAGTEEAVSGKDPTIVPGGAHLMRRSALLKRIQALAAKPRVLVVEDREQDARFLETALRRLFGADMPIVVARTAKDMKAASAKRFDVVILDDRLDAGITAETSIPMLRKAGHSGPIIVISALMTNTRQAQLRRLGVTDTVTKDDVDGTRLAELVVAALDGAGPAG